MIMGALDGGVTALPPNLLFEEELEFPRMTAGRLLDPSEVEFLSPACLDCCVLE